MALITLAYVKENFPLWGKYCVMEKLPDETILQKEIDLSIVKFGEFLTITDEQMTEALRLHLLIIVKNRCFQRKFGDSEFQIEPQIVKDYISTIKTLTGYKEGKLTIEPVTISVPVNAVKITAKPKRFGGEWFDKDYEGQKYYG